MKLRYILPASLILTVLKFTGISLSKRVMRIINGATIFDYSIGDIFLTLENELLAGNKHIRIGDHDVDQFVLCPMMMHFSCTENNRSETHYPLKTKRFEDQIHDLFHGIHVYKNETAHSKLQIYPFLGVTFDPEVNEPAQLKSILDSAFADYPSLDQHGDLPNEELIQLRKEHFMGKMDQMKDTEEPYYCGVKVYPPLGFDATPSYELEQDSADVLFDFCSKRGIPIVSHTSPGGYQTIDDEQAKDTTFPINWHKVLEKHTHLKLNFAHFGPELRGIRIDKWKVEIVKLMEEYPNVYTDLSCRLGKAKEYKHLLSTVDRLVQSQEINEQQLCERLLFGTDFPMCLFENDSYKEYIDVYGAAKLKEDLRNHLTLHNPEQFLFGKPYPKENTD